MEHRRRPLQGANGRFFLSAICLMLLFGILSYWSGLPPEPERPLFFIGVVIFLAIVFGFALLMWHLLIRPLPDGLPVPEINPITTTQQYAFSIVMFAAVFAIIVGGIWDEVWHRKYGAGFGEDLFWRPHQLMYAGFTTFVVLGFWSLIMIVRKGRGTLQQRFRSNKQLGILALMGGFFLYTLPADPVWHIIYGEDITAWSLPHLVLILDMTLVSFMAAALRLGLVDKRPFRFRMPTSDTIFVVTSISFAMMFMLQVFTTEWDALFTGFRNSPLGLSYWNRPDWILPVLIMMIAGFVGATTLHATKTVGTATMLGFIALIIRVVLVELFQFDGLKINSWLVILGPLVGLDLVYFIMLRMKHQVAMTWQGGLGVVIGTAVMGFPLISTLYSYPQMNVATIVPTLLIGTPMAIASIWLGQQIGTFFADGQKFLLSEQNGRFAYAIPAIFVGLISFFLFFILTATPPL